MFLKFLTGLDIYGHTVGVHYHGDSSFKTGFGAVLSLISLILIMFNTLGLFNAFITKEDQKESVRTFSESLMDVGPLNLRDSNLDILFTTDIELDPKYGTWKADKL